MSIEAFIWNYRDGEPIGFDYGVVRNILSTDDTDWLDEHGCLRVQFRDPSDFVETVSEPGFHAVNPCRLMAKEAFETVSRYLSRQRCTDDKPRRWHNDIASDFAP